ncbi:MAG: penicillin-binding protein [Acidobacteriota bacterium]|nr:penicillin-binding protein [Acidobacteriota bacterium]
MVQRTNRSKGGLRDSWDRYCGRAPRRSRKKEATSDWRHVVRGRVVVAGVVLGIWTVGIEARLVYLQVIDHERLVERANQQKDRTQTLVPKRGEIVDRNGEVLAYSVDADTIYAVPSQIENPTDIAKALCGALDACDDTERLKLTDLLGERRDFAYVKRLASLEEARRVAALGLQGVGFLQVNRRYYPNRELGAHVLGYVGIDNQGLSGIESTYDEDISGAPGQVLIQIDERQRVFSRVERSPTPGATLELTIDKYLQHIVERELKAGIDAYGADAGTVVMLDPKTGEVLALASEPSFNPNVFSDSTINDRRNRAIQDIYEPGSTFKVVTASAALEEQVVERDEIFDVSAGSITVGGDVIPDFHRYGELSFTDVMVKSSNVGAIEVGFRLGQERFSRYVRRFGFGQALSPDFPSESRGIVGDPSKLSMRGLASMAMGYQVAVTPLQMAAAIGAVANGGELISPRVVRSISQDGVQEISEQRVIRRAISVDTAAELTEIMEEIVQRGTGRRAQVPGYSVAGKTGTSEKLIDGRYSHYDHNASFVGFVPSNDPRLVMLVMIDTPRSAIINGVRQRAYTGGLVAAPIFQRIAEASLRHLAVPPSVHPEVPVIVDRHLPVSEAESVLTTVSFGATDEEDQGNVDLSVMPDLRGLSARQAMKVAGKFDLRIEFIGNGVVGRHEPLPGAEIESGLTTKVWLDRHTWSLNREFR